MNQIVHIYVCPVVVDKRPEVLTKAMECNRVKSSELTGPSHATAADVESPGNVRDLCALLLSQKENRKN